MKNGPKITQLQASALNSKDVFIPADNGETDQQVMGSLLNDQMLEAPASEIEKAIDLGKISLRRQAKLGSLRSRLWEAEAERRALLGELEKAKAAGSMSAMNLQLLVDRMGSLLQEIGQILSAMSSLG